MKPLLFDHNLSPRLVNHLAQLYPSSRHVATVGLDRATDREVWAFARQNDCMIVTKDADFGEMTVLMDAPPKVIWIRRGNCSTQGIEKLLRDSYESILAFSENSEAGIIELF